MRKDVGSWQVRLDDATIERYTASGDWLGRTVAELAHELAERDPARVTHVFEGRPCRVADLLADADALAGALEARGFEAGEVVSFQLPNWREAVLIDLACAMLGLVVAPIVPIYRDAEVGYMLADSGARAAFFPTAWRGFDYGAMMARLAPGLPKLQLLSAVRAGAPDADSFEALIGEGHRLRRKARVDPNSVKLLLYTSGTTGRPKGVLHTHNTGPATLRRAFLHWSQREGDAVLMASPVTHITGFSYGMELPLCFGTRTVFMERWNAAEALDIIEREQISASMGATPFLHELLCEAERTGRRLPSLRIFACGGAEVPPALIRKTSEVLDHCRAFRVYGSSEAPLVTLGFLGDDQMDLAAATDGEIVHYEVRVVDDEGRVLPDEQEGEIRVRGPARCVAYASSQQTAESFDAENFFATGDLGRITADRAIVITGRKKDLINRGGEKVSAKEVEDILHQHPAIEEAAVVAMPHPRLGETVCAYVVLKPGHLLDFEDMLVSVEAAGVARQKYPERMIVVDAFPRTASGKIRKDRLRADIRERLQAEA